MPTDLRTTLEQAEARNVYRAQLADMPLDVIIGYLRERGWWLLRWAGASIEWDGESVECKIGEWLSLE